MNNEMTWVAISTDCQVEFEKFYAGEVRKLPANRAALFVARGWAQDDIEAPIVHQVVTPNPVNLAVEGVRFGVKLEGL